MEINSISKKYNDKVVLDNISLTLKKKEIVGLVGNNGAGKSTLMKIITQTQPSFKGDIDEECKIGYFIENPKLYNNKTGLWHFKYFSAIFGNKFDYSEYEEILDGIGLTEVLNKKVKTYSLGMKEKLGVMISLLNKPEYVILDEPTNGMDVESSINLLDNIRSIADTRNIGFLISSHKLEDIEMICDRILFLDNCKISEEKNKNDEITYNVTIVFKNVDDAERFKNNQKLGKLTNMNEREIQIETTSDYAEIASFLKTLNIDMENYSSEKRTLRNIYMDKMLERRYEKTV